MGICVGPRDNSHVNQKAHVIQKVNDVRHVYEDVNASRDAIEITWIFAALLIHLRSYSAEILSLRLILSSSPRSGRISKLDSPLHTAIVKKRKVLLYTLDLLDILKVPNIDAVGDVVLSLPKKNSNLGADGLSYASRRFCSDESFDRECDLRRVQITTMYGRMKCHV